MFVFHFGMYYRPLPDSVNNTNPAYYDEEMDLVPGFSWKTN
jgi:hypothetical protein